MKSKDELIDQMVSEMPFVFNEKMRPYIKELMGIWGMLIIDGNAQQSQPSGMRWGIDSPFPLLEIIKRLSGAVEYLLHRKDYDGPDYEELQICIKEAKKFISESSPAGAAEGASEGMAEALRECINHGAFTFYCNTNNCICCSECKMPLTQSEFKEKLASLSPGVEDGSGWVKDETISDGFGGEWLKKCPDCGKDEMAVVRPGKVQCNNCG